MVASLAINPNTVSKAYRELGTKGLIVGRRARAPSSWPHSVRSRSPSSSRASTFAALLADQGRQGGAGPAWDLALVASELQDVYERRSGSPPPAVERRNGGCRMNVIETQGLGKSYGTTKALHDCSLAIPEGTRVSFVPLTGRPIPKHMMPSQFGNILGRDSAPCAGAESSVWRHWLWSPRRAAAPSSPPAQVERVSGGPTGSYIVPPGIHKIKHVIVVMQENRSFDSYFGTFPGADGIPMKNGNPTVCVPDPGERDAASLPTSTTRTSTAVDRTTTRMPRVTSTAARWTASSGKPSSGRRAVRIRPTRPARTRRLRTSWGITPGATSPTTGPTPRISSSRITCSNRTRHGACPPISSWSRSGRPTAPRRTTLRAA